ncbi:hypothetical protein CBR_g23290 [Chara braunii]|uniref:Uncharacterized protein n=1 Tax=Chara braunii TaxID=69332 RepID=A0A388L3T0_CHABU|nr:hypothetical protein CBR_g23290 [Chara braunii]|eukprot:GBG76960.1 hypothetical protein CBR_g23290 [Chara braunii]
MSSPTSKPFHSPGFEVVLAAPLSRRTRVRPMGRLDGPRTTRGGGKRGEEWGAGERSEEPGKSGDCDDGEPGGTRRGERKQEGGAEGSGDGDDRNPEGTSGTLW